MAVTQRSTNTQPDAAPLWLPRHETVVVDQAAVRAPDFVEGYTLQSRLMAAFLGSRWKMATNAATALAVLAFLVILPSLFDAGISNLVKVAFYQSWTMVILLAVTARVRSVAVGTVVRYWLAGMFTVVTLVWFVHGPLANLAGTGSRSAVWVIPPLEEIAKALPLLFAVAMGKRTWRTPGLTDLMILGFAVGGGYAFHEDALWERATLSGLEANAGLFVPSIYQPDGIFSVGHAVWTSLIGFAIGLFLLHRHQAWAVVGGVVSVLFVLGDHMAINDGEGTLGWIRQLTFNGKMLALVFLVAAVASALLDQRRLAAIGERDHLFPSERALKATPGKVTQDHDLVKAFHDGRYRRRRIGAHNTIDAAAQQWPPLCETDTAPVAELARLGGAAGVAVGPGTSARGWAPDPDDPDEFRFVGPRGLTSYAAGDVPMAVEEPSSAEALETTDKGGRLAKLTERRATRASTSTAVPTSTRLSAPKARPEAVAIPTVSRATDFWQYVGLGVVAVALFVFVRLLTAGDPSTALIATASLPDAPNAPALIQTVAGGLAAAVALRGRDQPRVEPGWAAGPGSDPIPERPDECEA